MAIPEAEYETIRNESADSRHVVSIESRRRQDPLLVHESSDASTTHFIELPSNPYLRKPADKLAKGKDLASEDEILRRTDPETYLYLVLLKKMQKNPDAKVT